MTIKPEEPRPVDRVHVQQAIARQLAVLRTWILFAIGLVALHVVASALMQAPWTERRHSSGERIDSSGWDLVSNSVPGGEWVVLSVFALVGSAFATFKLLATRSMRSLVTVIALSATRFVLVWVAAALAADEMDGRTVRHGVVLSLIVALTTVIVAWASRGSTTDRTRTGGAQFAGGLRRGL